MLINLMDPALRIHAGHHLDLDLGIVRELLKMGHDVRVYSHLDIAPDARAMVAGHCEVTPAFRLSPYMESARIDAPEDEDTTFARAAALVAEDLRSVRAAHAWIWPTLFEAQHQACVIAAPGVPISACIMTEPTYLRVSGRSLWRQTVREGRDRGLKLDLGVVEPAALGEYRALTPDGRVRAYPFPYDRIHEPKHATEPTTIGFFGNQRDEKGVYLFEEMVGALLREGYRVVLHDSSGCSAGTGHDRLRILLGFVPDLPAEIIKCDLLVAPYDARRYQLKGSGIVWSALANGIPIVAPRESAPGRLVGSLGAGKLFDAFTAAAVLRSIRDARNDYASISRAARDVSSNWMKQHGVHNFAKAMLEAAGQ